MLYFSQEIENQEGYRKGKLQVIEGRKAVHPKNSGTASCRNDVEIFIPGKFAWDFFLKYVKSARHEVKSARHEVNKMN